LKSEYFIHGAKTVRQYSLEENCCREPAASYQKGGKRALYYPFNSIWWRKLPQFEAEISTNHFITILNIAKNIPNGHPLKVHCGIETRDLYILNTPLGSLWWKNPGLKSIKNAFGGIFKPQIRSL
jgi:hypothetical protein